MIDQLITLITFFEEHASELGEQLLEHIGITLISLALAATVGVTTGIVLTRRPSLANPVLAFVNVVQTIPSLALLGFLLPFFGIGAVPAIIALFLYALLPIVRNTFTGISEVDPAVKEAAQGMGMTDFQVLLRVDLPLAIPVIFAGIRTAMVLTVGIATLCALIAAGGLGEFIFRGIAVNNVYMILAGAIPASLLAILLDALLGLIQTRVKVFGKPLLITTVLLLFLSVGFFLRPTSSSFRGGFPSEFMERKDGLKGLRKHYNMEFDAVEMEIGLMYQALKTGQVDLISGFSTDGRIQAYDLATLDDDLNFFPPYHCGANIYGPTLRKYPQLEAVFKLLEDGILDQEMIQMNFRVDENQESPFQVASDFLNSKRILGTQTVESLGSGPDIIIGSKNFTESFILAELFKLLIERTTDLKAEVKSSFGGTKLVFEALRRGDIDIYPEYSGTGLLVIIQPETAVVDRLMADPARIYDFVSDEYITRYDIYWMPSLGFNNTHAMLMRKNQAESLNIKSISDLKNYLDRLQ